MTLHCRFMVCMYFMNEADSCKVVDVVRLAQSAVRMSKYLVKNAVDKQKIWTHLGITSSSLSMFQ